MAEEIALQSLIALEVVAFLLVDVAEIGRKAINMEAHVLDVIYDKAYVGFLREVQQTLVPSLLPKETAKGYGLEAIVVVRLI